MYLLRNDLFGLYHSICRWNESRGIPPGLQKPELAIVELLYMDLNYLRLVLANACAVKKKLLRCPLMVRVSDAAFFLRERNAWSKLYSDVE